MKMRFSGRLALLIVLGLSLGVSAQAQTFSVLYNFGTRDGDPRNPQPPGVITQGRDGNLYSTSYGAAFRITPNGMPSVIYNFDDEEPFSGLTLGTDGIFYGTTIFGGSAGYGDVFKITSSGALTVLYSFTGGTDGGYPAAPPVRGSDGSFYGTTNSFGTANCGVLYKITSTGAMTTLYEFDETHGCTPRAPLVQATDGNLYGTTAAGGTANGGVIFKVTSTGELTVIYNLDAESGAVGSAPLIQGSDGNFYGATIAGGTTSNGTIFKITPTGKLTILHNFSETDGYGYAAGLVQATDGNFYGAAGLGGSNGYGTIYKITQKGSFSVLYNFDDTTGAFPLGILIQRTDGMLYGDTEVGGTGEGGGVFYRLNLGLRPFVSFVPPLSSGRVGSKIEILGQRLKGTTAVSFNGIPASFKVVSGTYLTAMVPKGATTGFVTVMTPSGKLTSNKKFRVN